MSRGRHRRPRAPFRALAAGTSLASGAAVSGAVVFTGHAAMASPAPSYSPAAVRGVAQDSRAVSFKPAGRPVYAVRPGDYLSLIASRHCGNPADWTGIYQASRRVIGPDPDLILPGQRLTLACTAAAVPGLPVAAKAVRGVAVYRPRGSSGAGSGDGTILSYVYSEFGSQAGCAVEILSHESGLSWADVTVSNPASGAYGLPQALPGYKMASAGADWATDPATQLRWMHGYVDSAYGGVCSAAWHDVNIGWY